MSILFRNTSLTKKQLVNINSNSTSSTDRIEMCVHCQDLNQSLIKTQLQLEPILVENEENTNCKADAITGMRKKFQHSFGLFIVFTFVILAYVCTIFFLQRILYYYTANINYYFYCLLFLTSFFKLLLKFIARKIDINNMNCNCNSTKWYHYISMELFIEFNVNLQYFTCYYTLFIYELSL